MRYDPAGDLCGLEVVRVGDEQGHLGKGRAMLIPVPERTLPDDVVRYAWVLSALAMAVLTYLKYLVHIGEMYFFPSRSPKI